MQNLSKSQRRSLLSNRNVLKITDSHVVFASHFKVKVAELYKDGESPEVIFTNHGIDPHLFISDFCRNCAKRWLKKYETEGAESFEEDGRGLKATGRPRQADLDSLSNEDLKDIIAVQEELIELLKKKKALAKRK